MLSRFAVQGSLLLFLGLSLGACAGAPVAPAVALPAAEPAPPPAVARVNNKNKTVSDESTAAESGPAKQSSREELAEFVAPPSDEARDVATVQTLEAAKAQFQAFIDRAGDKAEYADAVQRSRERLEDIQAQIDFLKQGIAERKAQSSAEPRESD